MNVLNNMQKVYKILSDEESRFTWLNRMNYLITDDSKYLDAIVEVYLPGLPKLGSRSAEDILFEIPRDRSFVLFGAACTGMEVLPYFQKDTRFFGFCSSTKEKQKNGFCGWPVMSPEELMTSVLTR